jgi:hypothetical protein
MLRHVGDSFWLILSENPILTPESLSIEFYLWGYPREASNGLFTLK